MEAVEKYSQFMVFQTDEIVFKFRGSEIPADQYEFPFTFLIPADVPPSFFYRKRANECYSVKYTIEVYLGNFKPHIFHLEKSIKVVKTSNLPFEEDI